MNFSWASTEIINRRKVCRQDWSAGTFVCSNSKNVLYVGFTLQNKEIVLMEWSPTDTDFFANDWELFEIQIDEPETIPPAVEEQDDAILRTWKFIQKWEGGSKYTNDPNDPGGPTKWGVALNYNKDVIPDKNNDGVINATDVQLLEEADGLAIFIQKYWVPCKCGLLPPAVSLVYADMCYNIGQGASPKLLQECLNKFKDINLVVDGKIGEATLAAVDKIVSRGMEKNIVQQLSADRLEYYKTRKNWAIYGKGWTNRTNDCEKEALKLIGG